jgi:hypothetical protein
MNIICKNTLSFLANKLTELHNQDSNIFRDIDPQILISYKENLQFLVLVLHEIRNNPTKINLALLCLIVVR